MGHHNGGSALAKLVQGLLDQDFRGVVQGGSGFVQNQDGGILQKYPGDGQTLLLAAGETDAPLADLGIVAIRQGHHIVVDVGSLSCGDDLFLRGIQPSVENVVPDTAVEEEYVLLDDTDVLPERFQGQTGNVLAVDLNGAGGRTIEPGQQMADGGLAAAGGAYQGQNIALGNVQVDVLQHFPAVVVAEAYILQGNVSLRLGQALGIVSFFFHRLVHDLQEAAEAGHTVLILLYKVNQGVHRVDEQIYGHDEGGVIGEVDPVVVQEQTAGDENDHVEHIGDEGSGGEESSHSPVSLPAGLDILLIAGFKFFHFLFRIGEGLGDPDAGDAGLNGGVDDGVALSAVVESRAHLLAHGNGHRDHNGHTGKDDQGQEHIDGAKIGERADDHHGADKQVFRAVVGKLADFKQVAGKPGHDAAGLVIVEEGVGQLLQMGKEVAAHLLLHTHAHDMAVVLYKVAQQHPQNIQSQHHHTGNDNVPVEPVGNQVVEHPIGDHGIYHADQGNQQGGNHVQGEHELVGLVIGNEPFQHLKSSLSWWPGSQPHRRHHR